MSKEQIKDIRDSGVVKQTVNIPTVIDKLINKMPAKKIILFDFKLE